MELLEAATELACATFDLAMYTHDYAHNQSTRSAQRHNGTAWVPARQYLHEQTTALLAQRGELTRAMRSSGTPAPTSCATAVRQAGLAADAAYHVLNGNY